MQGVRPAGIPCQYTPRNTGPAGDRHHCSASSRASEVDRLRKGVRVPLQVIGLLLGDGDGIGAGDEAARGLLLVGEGDEAARELGGVAHLLAVHVLVPPHPLRMTIGVSLGIGLIPYSPLHLGLLAGVLDAATEGRISDDSRHRIEAHRDQLDAYEGLCRELGAHPAEVALAWLLRNPVVATTVIGATTTEELRADLGAMSVQLNAEAVERLDRIWPGPGEAPQAYAW